MYRVLIVEDEQIIQRGLQFKVNWLKNHCMVIGCADNGEEGEEKILALKPDIIITDVRMPFKDGLEMLRETYKKVDYQAMIISGFSEFEYAQQAITMGVHSYMLKPIDMQEFEQSLASLVQRLNEQKIHHHLEANQLLFQQILNVDLLYQIQSSLINEAIQYIKLQYQQKLTLKQVSETLNVSSVTLNLKFKEYTQFHFNEFLNRYRIIKALELLQDDSKLVYEIAEEVGYSEYKYFSSVFKKFVGMSPKQFIGQ
ncbi:AraC family transcriptional regulator [Alkalihalobacillus pseudalcaliphilus]|nr:AraC family transcriptional regulator [Alkalihalobacillus pseudalcaliphilus]